MHAVGPEIGATHEHDHPGVAPAGFRIGPTQRLALGGAHGAVAKGKVQVPDLVPLLVPDLAVTRVAVRHDFRHRFELSGQQPGGRQLERMGRLPVAQVAYPYGAVAGCPAQSGVATGDDLTGFTAQGPFRTGVIEEQLPTKQVVKHPRRTIGTADLTQHGVRVVLLPVDRPVRLLNQRPRPTAHLGIGIIERLGLEVSAGETCHRL